MRVRKRRIVSLALKKASIGGSPLSTRQKNQLSKALFGGKFLMVGKSSP
ncbi:MAG: hypothetical protein KBD90_05735 [Alphaproteobacteria bacterium]|nr:hypothetical protein [Alphaproteobacteria bacterium]